MNLKNITEMYSEKRMTVEFIALENWIVSELCEINDIQKDQPALTKSLNDSKLLYIRQILEGLWQRSIIPKGKTKLLRI